MRMRGKGTGEEKEEARSAGGVAHTLCRLRRVKARKTLRAPRTGVVINPGAQPPPHSDPPIRPDLRRTASTAARTAGSHPVIGPSEEFARRCASSVLEGIPAIVLFGPLLFPIARQVEAQRLEDVRQARLVDDVDRVFAVLAPDAAVVPARNLHAASLTRSRGPLTAVNPAPAGRSTL